MENEKRVPGITFHLVQAKVLTSITHKAFGHAELDADVDDLEMWEQVVKKLDGLRIYQSDDFVNEIVEVLQDDRKRLEQELEQLNGHALTTEETLKQQNSLLAKQNALLDLEVRKLLIAKAVLQTELDVYNSTLILLAKIMKP